MSIFTNIFRSSPDTRATGSGGHQTQDARRMEQRIMAKLNELAAALATVGAKLDKAKVEIVGQIEALKAALADTEIPADAQTELDKLAATAQALDDITPDADPPAPPTE